MNILVYMKSISFLNSKKFFLTNTLKEINIILIFLYINYLTL